MRAWAARWRVASVSGIRASRSSASALPSLVPPSMSSAARPVTACSLPGSSSSAWRSDASSPAATSLASFGLLLGGQERLDPRLHLVLGQRADEAVDDLAVVHGVDGRDRLHLERLGDGPGWRRRRPWPARPCRSVASTTFSRIGPSVLHGPHHSAHRSTTTGTCVERSITSASNVCVGHVDVGHGGQPTGDARSHRPAGSPAAGSQGAHRLANRRRGREGGTVADVQGIDGEEVTAWFEEHVPGAVAPLDVRRSSPAATRTSPTGSPTPTGGALGAAPPARSARSWPRAHDMGREHRIIAALHATDVPVAPPLGLVHRRRRQRRAVLRHGLRRRARPAQPQDEAEALSPEARRPVPASRSSTCWPRIHAVDVDAVGLGDLGRKDGYIERQLKRWYGQWEKSKTRELPDDRRGARAAQRRGPRAGAGRHRPRRLPPRQLHGRRPTARSSPSSTGSCAPSATRSPTSAC